VAITLITLVIYLPALQNGFVGSWDDGLYILDNTYIHSLRWEFFRWAFTDTSVALYWHPLTWISHAADYALWGPNPFGHHLTSIVLHALNTGIVVWLTIRLLDVANEDRAKDGRAMTADRRALLMTAGITGILFGLHPLHVESVAWIAMRKDLLYSLFYLLSILSYLRYARDPGTAETQRAFYLEGRYWASLLLFILALCSKPMAVTLPAVLLLLDWYPLNRIRSWKSLAALIAEKIPFLVLSGIVSIIAAVAQKSGEGLKTYVEVSFDTRLLIVFRALTMYLWKIIVPVNLQPLHPYPKEAFFTEPAYLSAIILTAAITAGVVLIARKSRLPMAVWAFFIITLLPVIGFFQTGGQFMADRYAYLASLGPFLLMGLGFSWGWTQADTLKQKVRAIKPLIATALIALTVTLSFLTIKQIGLWQNALVLWSSYIDKGLPRLPEFYFFRGDEFRRNRQRDLAIEDYTAAISIDPRYGSAYINRGEVFLEKGQFDQAIADFSKAIALEPYSVDSRINLGNAYHKRGEPERAIEEYSAAISLKPAYDVSYINRGIVYKETGEIRKAIEDFTKALTLNSDLTIIHLVRGDLYVKTGAIDLAIRDYQKACELGSESGCRKSSSFAR